jgi:hypothetical protein
MRIYCCNYRPVHGLIFLFKWQPETEPQGSIVQDSRLEKIFFAKQVDICNMSGIKYTGFYKGSKLFLKCMILNFSVLNPEGPPHC